jgi:hypothetical protein
VAPTLAQVREQVTTIRQKVKDARVVAIRADGWTGPDRLDIEGAAFRVVFSRSPLHVREELLEIHDGLGLIVLTPLSERDLGADVLARVAKRQLFDIDTWRIALDLFKARVARSGTCSSGSVSGCRTAGPMRSRCCGGRTSRAPAIDTGASTRNSAKASGVASRRRLDRWASPCSIRWTAPRGRTLS